MGTDEPFGEIIAMPGTGPPHKVAESERWMAEHDPETYAERADLRELYWAAHAEALGKVRDEDRIRAAVAVVRANGRTWTEIAVCLGVESQRIAKQRYG